MSFVQHFMVIILIISQVPQPGECSITQAFFRINKSKYLANHVIETKQAETELECGVHCVRHGSCVSVNYKTSGIGTGLCELNNKVLQNADHDERMKNPDFSHLYIIEMRPEDNLRSNTPDSPKTGNMSMISDSCKNESWSTSFESRGWSSCSSTFPYIKGLYRSKTHFWSWDSIRNLERASCCKGFENVKSDCVEKDWLTSFSKKNHWNLCTLGYYLSGLYRSDDHYLHNIEKAWCCKPHQAPSSYTSCYDEDVSQKFGKDKFGWVSCTQARYYITGFYRSSCDDLHCIDRFKCCKI